MMNYKEFSDEIDGILFESYGVRAAMADSNQLYRAIAKLVKKKLAVKYHAFVEHAKTADILRSSVCKAKLEFYFYKHPHVYLKKAGAEGYFVKPDACGDYFGALRPYIYTSAQKLGAGGCQIHGNVLVAVLIPTAVEYTVCVDINGIASEVHTCATDISVFRHKTSSSKSIRIKGFCLFLLTYFMAKNVLLTQKEAVILLFIRSAMKRGLPFLIMCGK